MMAQWLDLTVACSLVVVGVCFVVVNVGLRGTNGGGKKEYHGMFTCT